MLRRGTPGLDAEPAPAHRQGAQPAPLLVATAAVVAGIVLDRIQSDYCAGAGRDAIGCMAWWLVAGVTLLVWRWRHSGDVGRANVVLLLTSISCLAAGWHHWHWNGFAAIEAGRYATDQPYPCCVEAVAMASPERVAAPPKSPYRAIPAGEKSQLPLRIVRIRNGEQWQSAQGECELFVDGHLLGVSSRDRLLIFCQFARPSAARNPGQFDFAKHQRADRRLCVLRCESPQCVTVISKPAWWSPLVWIDHLRSRWQSKLWAELGEQHAPMASAILLGSRNAMPRESMDPFKVTGAMHVLVVSGLHASVVIALISLLLGLGILPKHWALALSMILVAAYAILTGAYPPVVRAAILAELSCLALWFNRNPLAFNSLAVAAVVVLAMNPADLFRTGPQLSFLCVGMLLWFSTVQWREKPSPLKILIFNSRPWFSRVAIRCATWMAVAMAATLAVWIVSLPLLMLRYNLITPVAVVAGPAVFLALIATLVTGFVLLVGGWLLPALEPLFASVCSVSVATLENVVHSTSQWPAAYTWAPSPPLWWVLGWYLLLVLVLRPGGTIAGWQRALQLVTVWLVIAAVPVALARGASKHLQATFLDVGHGVCVVVTTPDGGTLLYDAGSLGSPSYATETISTYLWSRGIRQIDGVVLSHPDIDHFNALPGLLDRFEIGRVFVSPHMFPRRLDPSDMSAPAELRRALEIHAVRLETIQLGDRLSLDDSTQAVVLYPDHLGNIGSDNANSLVLAIECGRHRILLPGDLETPGIDHLMADEPYDCDVLLAPHHGSRRSDPPGFAAWSRPEYVVVSGRQHAGYGETADSYRAYGAVMLPTSKHGAVEVHLLDEEVQIRPYLAEKQPQTAAGP